MGSKTSAMTISNCQFVPCCVFVCCFVCAFIVSCFVRFPLICIQFLYCSSVVCLYVVVLVDGLRWGMTLGVGNAMFIRGGACVTELCLMVGWVCCIMSGGCGLSSYVFWEGTLRFRIVWGTRCVFGGLKLYGFGAGFVTSIG